MFRLRELACLTAGLLSAVCASAQNLPFAYPSSLLEAPATLTEPPADFVRLGKPKIVLEVTTLEEAAAFTGAPRIRDGRGDFARDIACLAGTEASRPVRVWMIASDTVHVTEVQLEWAESDTPPVFCRKLAPERLPVRLGPVGLGMTEKEVLELAGKPSYRDAQGWSYWFSQRFLRNARNLQELELNWLAVRFEKGRVAQAFISLVKNP